IVAFTPLNFVYTDYQERAEEALELLEISHIKDKTIWELSGGEKHLTAIAGALALNPTILIVDEPVAQLDPQHATEVYEKLKFLNEELGKTIITIEHHTEFIANYCNQVALIENGKVKWHEVVRKGLYHITQLQESHIYPPQVTQAAMQFDRITPNNDLPITVEEATNYFKNHYFYPDTNRHQPNLQTTNSAIVSVTDLQHEVKLLNKKRRTVLDID